MSSISNCKDNFIVRGDESNSLALVITTLKEVVDILVNTKGTTG